MRPRVRAGCASGFALLLALLIPHTISAQEHAESAHHRFQDPSHWARVFEAPARAEWQKPDEVVRALNLKPGQTVVDIGAGTGYFTRRFARAVGPGGRAIGLDIEPGMVDYMKADAKKLKLSNYEARLVRPNDPQLAPHSADVVFFCDVLHHIDDRVAYLKRVGPALNPGGRVAVVDFKKTAPIGPPASMKIARSEMIAEFKDAGYRPVRERYFLPHQYFLEFAHESP
jgi:ubiquinone/menaquinone biosynthesis C-methylase UbiE